MPFSPISLDPERGKWSTERLDKAKEQENKDNEKCVQTDVLGMLDIFKLQAVF